MPNNDPFGTWCQQAVAVAKGLDFLYKRKRFPEMWLALHSDMALNSVIPSVLVTHVSIQKAQPDKVQRLSTNIYSVAMRTEYDVSAGTET